MECPKCFGETEQVSAGNRMVERCLQCFGLFFYQLTQSMVDDLLLCVDIDTGNDELGVLSNQMVYVDCPNCNRIMDQRQIEGRHRIRFELCTSCYVVFLDAGELRQYTRPETLADFRSLLPGPA